MSVCDRQYRWERLLQRGMVDLDCHTTPRTRNPNMSRTLGLTGDVMLGRTVNERQRRRPVDAVWGDLLERLRSLDGLIINLECCLTSGGSPWDRTYRPFHFRADPDWEVSALQRAGVDICALANNHILDFGEEALRDTVTHLETADIAYTGAGRTLDEALEPAVVSLDGFRVVVSFTDNTPEYAASETDPGTAYVQMTKKNDETWTLVDTALDRARSRQPDLLVASLHWGPNMVEEPSEGVQVFGRWLVENGVDVIHGHSAHVFQGIEIYTGQPILYDTGDFVDDYAIDDRLRNDRSFLFRATISGGKTLRELRLFPTEISNCSVQEASQTASEWSHERMRTLSAPFGTMFERDGSELVLPREG